MFHRVWPVAILTLGPCMPAGADAPTSRLIAIDGPGYSVLSAIDEKRSRQVVTELASFHRLLETSLRRTAEPTGIPTRICILSRRDWQRYISDRPGLAGMFVPSAFANFLLIDAGGSHAQTMPAVFHEYTHFFLLTQFPGDYPPWFDEGMAEFMSTARFKGSVATLDLPAGRIHDMRHSEWIPFERLLRIDRDDAEYREHRLASGFYGQAWLIVHYGVIEDPAFGTNTLRYIRMRNSQSDIDAALAQSFGTTAADLDTLLRRYAQRERLTLGTIRIGEVPKVGLGAARELDEADAAQAIAEVMLSIGVPPVKALPLLDAALATSTRPKAVQALRALATQMIGDDARAETIAAQLESQLTDDDGFAWRTLGLTLFNRLEMRFPDDEAYARAEAQAETLALRSRELFGAAYRIAPHDLEACWGYALTSFMAEVGIDEGIETLRACRGRASRSAELAMALAIGHAQRGDVVELRANLADAIRYARHAERRAQARRMLEIVDGRLSELE